MMALSSVWTNLPEELIGLIIEASYDPHLSTLQKWCAATRGISFLNTIACRNRWADVMISSRDLIDDEDDQPWASKAGDRETDQNTKTQSLKPHLIRTLINDIDGLPSHTPASFMKRLSLDFRNFEPKTLDEEDVPAAGLCQKPTIRALRYSFGLVLSKARNLKNIVHFHSLPPELWDIITAVPGIRSISIYRLLTRAYFQDEVNKKLLDFGLLRRLVTSLRILRVVGLTAKETQSFGLVIKSLQVLEELDVYYANCGMRNGFEAFVQNTFLTADPKNNVFGEAVGPPKTLKSVRLVGFSELSEYLGYKR